MSSVLAKAQTFETSRPDRVRDWLDPSTPYEAPKWKVRDEGGGTDVRELDFEVPMPDGRLLTDHTRLYDTAKELTFWIREGVHISFADAEQHRNYFSAIVQLCYVVVERQRSSFAELTELDIEEMAKLAAYGADHLYGASAKVRAMLAPFTSWSVVPDELRGDKGFNRDAVIAACNLPKWRTRKVHFEFECATARLNGTKLPERPAYFDEMITKSNVTRYLTVMEALFVLRPVMKAEGLLFKPFPEGAEVRGIAMGRQSTKTPIAPISLVLSLLEKSVITLVEKAEPGLARYQLMVNGRSDGSYRHLEAVAARADLITLASACYVLIAAFTARRTQELRLIERDCLAGNDGYGWWMKVYIVKNHKTKTWIPVPNIVARAVETMQKLDFRNELKPTDSLFTYFDAPLNKVVEFHLHLKLNEYAVAVGAATHVNAEGVRSKWHWQGRQFRRFFAVLFLYRFQGNIEALSHHLRHFNLEMTRSYLTLDPDLSAIWLNEEWGFKKSLATAIATGGTSYSGAMGERLKKTAKKLVEKFYGSITVVEEEVIEMTLRIIDRRHYIFTPKPWVTCTCPNTHSGSAKAACRRLDEAREDNFGPNFANAGPTVCINCPWALLNKQNRDYVDRVIADLAVTNDNQPTTLFGELQALNLVSLQAFRAKQGA